MEIVELQSLPEPNCSYVTQFHNKYFKCQCMYMSIDWL